jgi:hypothetical protein
LTREEAVIGENQSAAFQPGCETAIDAHMPKGFIDGLSDGEISTP